MIAWRLRTSSSIVCWMFALSSSPSDCMPPVPSRTRSDAASASSSTLVSAGSSPTASVASHAVTWIRRSCPALAAAPVRPVRTERVPSSGPSLYVPAWRLTRRPYAILRLADPEPRTGDRPWPLSWTTRSRRRSRLDESFTAITDLERVVPAVQGGSVLETTGPDAVKAEILVKMGAMSMKFTGTVEVTEKDEADHRAVLTIKSARGRRAGARQRDGHLRARRRRREHPHERPDHGQGGLHGRGRRRRRARRADHRLHHQAGRHLTPWRAS